MARKYRVVRSISLHDSDSGKWESEIIWQGTDPAEYEGGLGAFDCGDYYATRWMEVFNPSTGEWEEVEV